MKKKHKYLRAKPAAGKGKKLTVVLVCVAVLLAILIGAMLFLINNREEPAPTEPAPTETAAPVPTETETVPPTTEETVPEETQLVMLAHMEELYEQNQETVGWIVIDGTHVDYPVMQTPEDPEKYIHLSFEENYSYGGVPFVDAKCSMDPESQNLLVYGHNMRDGSQFASIMNYQKENYWKDHRYIKYNTLYEERVYEIFAAFPDRVYKISDDVFKFYQFIDPKTEEEFNEGIEYFKNKTPYDTGVEVEYGDSLITLITCAYHEQYGRFVVVGRLVTGDEAAQIIDAAE